MHLGSAQEGLILFSQFCNTCIVDPRDWLTPLLLLQRPAAGAEHAACNNSWNLLDSRSHSSYHSRIWGAARAATLPSGRGSILVTTMARSATGIGAPPCLVGGTTFFLWPLGGATCPSECSDSEVVGTSGSNASG